MAIELRTRYVVVCDKCEAESFWSLTTEEAERAAREQDGYVTATHWNGQAYVTMTLCSDCQEAT